MSIEIKPTGQTVSDAGKLKSLLAASGETGIVPEVVTPPAEENTQNTQVAAQTSGFTTDVGRAINLEDLSLPVDIIEHILAPCLQRINLVFFPRHLISEEFYYQQSHYVSLITNNYDYYCLLTVPNEILTTPVGHYLLRLKVLVELLLQSYKDHLKLFIAHDWSPTAKFKAFMAAQISKPNNLPIGYLDCSELREINEWEFERQVDYVLDMISLRDLLASHEQPATITAQPQGEADGKPPGRIGGGGKLTAQDQPDKKMPIADKSFLDFNDRRDLNRLAQEISVFKDGDEADRRSFLENDAGLEVILQGIGIDLSKSAATLVPTLTKKCELTGELKERPGYHALGALIEAVIDREELSQNSVKTLFDFVKKYQLITDADFYSRMLENYQIT
jgi:hypothetical protein